MILKDKTMINFKKYDLEGLLRLFNNDFYSVIKNERMFFDYLKAISYKLCDLYQTDSYPPIKIDHIEDNVVGRTKARREIILNDKYFYAFPIYSKLNNLFYAFEMISTLIHETRHYLQANAKVNIDPLVKAFSAYKAVAPAEAMEHISYGTAINETDARNFTNKFLCINPEFNKYLQSQHYIKNEEKLSKQLSSHALSIEEALKQIDHIIPQKQFAILDMDKCYSLFLDEAGIRKEDYKQEARQNLGTSGLLSLQAKLMSSLSLSRFVKEVYDSLLLAPRASRDDLAKILDESKFKLKFMPAVTEDEKQTLFDRLELRALLHYETDMLYKKLAPEHFDLIHREGQTNPEDIRQFYMIRDLLDKEDL